MHTRLTIRQLVDELGPTLLRVGRRAPGMDRPVTGVVIHDPGDPAEPEPGSIVLGVGVDSGSTMRALSRELGNGGVLALAVKAPLPEELDDCAIPILEINPGASWMHLATTVAERLLDQDRDPDATAGPMGDLFGIANAVSDVVGAPVTIEDRHSAVLAWSADQQNTDDARVETILGRAVHRRWLDDFDARGVFTRLHTEPGPIFIEPSAPGLLPRVAIAVRAGTQVLGYIWAAVSVPVTDEQAAQLRELTPIVALHLVNTRAGAARATEQRSELAAAVLAGGQAGRDAARSLHLGEGPLCVLATARRPARSGRDSPPVETAEEAARLHRFEDSFALYLAATHPSSVTVVQGEVVYALLSWPRRAAAAALAAAEQLGEDFLSRSPMGDDHVIAVGGPVESVDGAETARAQADAVLRVMRRGRSEWSVATPESAALSVLLLHLAEGAAELGLPERVGPLQRLASYEGPDGELSRTLRAYLDAGGVADEAAAALQVHVNTVRYRLRRIREVAELDLHDANAVLLAHLQLRMALLRD